MLASNVKYSSRALKYPRSYSPCSSLAANSENSFLRLVIASSVLLARIFGRKMYLSSLLRYVSINPSRALTYPLDHWVLSDFCRIISSSFSASVQALASTCSRNLFTGICGITFGPPLSTPFDLVFFRDINYSSLCNLEDSLALRQVWTGDKSGYPDGTGSSSAEEHSCVACVSYYVPAHRVYRVGEELVGFRHDLVSDYCDGVEPSRKAD